MHLIIMGLLKRLLLKKKLKSIGLGLLDSIPVVSTIKANIDSQHPTLSGFDWLRFTTSAVTIGTLLAFLTGKISLADFQSVITILR